MFEPTQEGLEADRLHVPLCVPSYLIDRSIGVALSVFLLLATLSTLPVSGQSTESVHVYPFSRDDRVGLMDQSGRILAPAVFDAAGQGEGGMIPLRAGSRWGLWSGPDSSWVIDAAYDAVVLTGDQVAVRDVEGWRLMTPSGRTISDAVYHELRPPEGGVFSAAVLMGQGPVDERLRWGVFTVSGDTLVAPRFENLLGFTSGLAAARVSRRLLRFIRRSPQWGFIGTDGTWRIPPEFDSARSFSDGLALVSGDGQLFFIDPSGRRRFTVEHNLAYSFSEGRARILDRGLWGWIDTNGKVIVQPTWEGALDYSEGRAAVRRAGQWGYVDLEGRVVIPVRFGAAAPFRGPLAEVVQDGRRFRIDRSGREIIPRMPAAER